MHYQDINEILAKGIKTENMLSDYADAISCANAYLREKKGTKPEWLDDFLDSNRCKLVETICRATSVSQGISSLQGYSEGYFNEIIQNANDLHCGDTMAIEASKNGTLCRLNCQYDDKGFELSNIYAFLNREMSDKTEDDSQTGKFGVGIKSFFKFVDSLIIQSNVYFDFKIDRRNRDYHVTGQAEVNDNWDGKSTVLSISYESEVASSFNTRKLTDLIHFLCGQKNTDVMKCFLTGNDDELVFDARSLIFMFINAKSKKNIATLKFSGSCHTVDINCNEENKLQNLKVNEEFWKVGVIQLQISVDKELHYSKKYIVFNHDGISFAFPIGEFSLEHNRMYSTYYLKADMQEQVLPLGMLIDSKYANIHRNDVGDSEDKINLVYGKVRGYIKNMYGFMCSEEASKLVCAEEISDVFHHIIARYLFVNKKDHWETPLSEAYFNNKALPKICNETAKSYIVKHQFKEAYDTSSYQEGDIVQELRESYFDYVEEKNVYDLSKLLLNSHCIAGVRKIYSMLSDCTLEIPEQNREAAFRITNYFEEVREFLVFVIAQERRSEKSVTDAEIDHWLISLKEKIGKYFDAKIFMKLVGRYALNDAIAYDGSIRQTNLSFKDYLFNGTLIASNGLLAQYQNQYYDEKYFQLKEELMKKRYMDYGNKRNPYMIRCIRPYGRSMIGWDGTYDYYEMTPPSDAQEELSQPQLLLERMATDAKFHGMWLEGSTLKLFETKANGMWRRDYQFKNFIIDNQQIIQMSCMKEIKLKKFPDFINAVKYRAMLSERLKDYISISCKEEAITTHEIVENVLPIMTEAPDDEKSSYLLDEFDPTDIEIERILENSSNEIPHENADFIYKTTGYRVHLYRFVSNTKRKMLAYFGNGKCAIRTDASKKFREVARYSLKDKNIFIFYDNIPSNLQQAVNGVLEEIGVNARKLELLEGYIHNGNTTKTMSYMSRRRNLAKVRKKLLLDWADVGSISLSKIDNTEILYRLLTARGSYDIFCPICSDIPLELFDYGEDTKQKHSRKIVLMENENPDTKGDVPYIITVACSYCCQRLRSTLIKSEFDGKNIVLSTQIAHGMHEKSKSRQQIELSPINIELMRKFKL